MEFSISNIQKQFYINNMMHPKDTSYLIPSLFKINGTINVDLLEKSINAIICRYDILRSIYTRKGSQISQSFVEECEAKIKVSQVAIEEEFKRIDSQEISNEIHESFKLDKWPLFRVKLFSFKNEVSILAITFHHIIIDLHSKMIFGNEFSNNYNHLLANDDLLKEETEHSYAEFASWEKEWIDCPEANKMIDFWKMHLDGAELELDLPTDHQRPSLGTKKGKRVYFKIDKSRTNALKSFGKEILIDPFVILLSAYVMLCNRLSGQDHVVVGVPVTNRRKPNFKNIFGPLLNIVPLHINFSDVHDKGDLIKQVRIGLLKAHRNQEIPFLYLLENIDFKKSFSRNPLFQIGFTSEPPMEVQLDGLCVTPMIVEKLGSQMDLFFTFWERDEEIHVLLEYSSDLFNESTVCKWIDEYKDIVADIISS